MKNKNKSSAKPLSYKQEKIWFVDQFERGSLYPESPTYFNQSIFFNISGDLKEDVIRKSIYEVVARHEILQTIVRDVDGKPFQYISKDLFPEFKVVNIHEMHGKQGEESGFEVAVKAAQKPFNLSTGPLLRTDLLKVDSQTYILVLVFHHMVFDPKSAQIFVNEMFEIYESYVNNRKPVLPELPIQYADYAGWEQNIFTDETLESFLFYWRNKLKEPRSALSIPMKKNRPNVHIYGRGRVDVLFDERFTASLKDFSIKENIPIHVVLLSAFQLTLSRYTNERDIIIGTTAENRAQIEAKNVIGPFVNSLILRNYLSGHLTVMDMLHMVHMSTLESYEYKEIPFDKLVFELKLEKDMSRIPIFDAMFQYKNNSFEIPKVHGLDISVLGTEMGMDKYDIDLQIINNSERMNGDLLFNDLYFDKQFISQFVGNFKTVVTNIIANPQKRLEDLKLLTQEEEGAILNFFNQKHADYHKGMTIHELFEEQVKKTPQHTAVIFQDESVTYEELNQRANQLAHYLRKKGVKPDTLVGIVMGRSIQMVVAILGILKAGGAYLPVDKENTPVERIQLILDDCKANIVLTQDSYIKDIPFVRLHGQKQVKEAVIITSPREQIKNLDALPFPDRRLVNYNKYNGCIGEGGVKNNITLQATRGCPYECLYCHYLWPKTHIFRSAQNIYEEILLHYNRGYRTFSFIDDVFNLDRNNSEEFFKLIIKSKLKLRILFPSGLRGDILTPEYIDLMAESGVVQFVLALETASPRLQKLIRKNINIEKLKKNLEYAAKNHPSIVLDLFTMIGFPTETEEEALLTLDFIKSVKWLHFPYINIVRIFPNTAMAQFAKEHGVSDEAIAASADLPYHEVGKTVPFSESFVRELQAKYMNEYFLNSERLNSVMPYQRKVFSQDEIADKYNSYFSHGYDEIKKIIDIKSNVSTDIGEKHFSLPSFPELNLPRVFDSDGIEEGYGADNKLRILLLDLSQLFAEESIDTVYNVQEAPLGLMYLLSYINENLRDKIKGKILKSGIDFENFDKLKILISDFNPDLICIRTLTFYRNYFHRTVSLLKNWCPEVPIITGGPYASSDYNYLLSDRNIDLVVIGEGELTFKELIQKILENNNKLPNDDILIKIPGIAFISRKNKNLKEFSYARDIVLLDRLEDIVSQERVTNPENQTTPYHLAYCIYTSGSTGSPKGSLITHSNVQRLFMATQDWYHFNENDTWTFFHSYAFDFSVWEIWGSLLYGGKLIVTPYLLSRSPEEFCELLSRERVTVLNQTPSSFNQLIRIDQEDKEAAYLNNLRYVIFGGESLNIQALKPWFNRHSDTKPQLINMYGITETTVHVTYRPIVRDDTQDSLAASPIGRPIPDLQCYIFDANRELVPNGVSGELYVGGDGLARGYLNRPDLTAEKFIPNPFGKEEGERLYKTGDSARHLPDGNIEFLGRIDYQVKIRGFRVELGEIESVLREHSGIEEAVVIARERKDTVREDPSAAPCADDKYLVAYLILKTGHTKESLGIGMIRNYLKSKLPEYMVPSHIVFLEELPYTQGGKINRKALPDPDIGKPEFGTKYLPPRSPEEAALCKIFQEILGVEKIGINDNFFDLGGHSLLATQVINRIRKVFDIDIRLQILFEGPSVLDLANYIVAALTKNKLPENLSMTDIEKGEI